MRVCTHCVSPNTNTRRETHLIKPALTRFVIGGRYGRLHHDLYPPHLRLGRGHHVQEAPPQVPHLRHLRGDGEALVDARGPLEGLVAEVVGLASYLDLQTGSGAVSRGGLAGQGHYLGR